MKSQDRLAGMLGMAAKAGKLVYGCNLTVEKVRRQQTPLSRPYRGRRLRKYQKKDPELLHIL